MAESSERRVRPRRAAGGLTDELAAAAGTMEEHGAVGRVAKKIRAPPGVTEDLHMEFLLRLPPELPKHLFRFAAVSKGWRRMVHSQVFLREYHKYHAANPPMLGYLYNQRCAPAAEFVAIVPACFAPRLPDDGRGLYVIDCRQGRVLFHKLGRPCTPESIIVWDPVSGHQNYVSFPEEFESTGGGRWSAAVLGDADDTCVQAISQGGSFRIVFVAMTGEGETSAYVYRSKTSSWSAATSAEKPPTADADYIERKAATMVANNLFFRTSGRTIVRLQFSGEGAELSFLELPPSMAQGAVLVPAPGGRILRSAAVAFQSRYVRFCDTEAGGDGPAEWTPLTSVKLAVAGFGLLGSVETTGEILVGTGGGRGPYVFDIQSRCSRALPKPRADTTALTPLMGFYTPEARY
ncbi:unnamed protein product [Urochloa decumbens]|uniref:F-box domain-containing protein n=1 Tax=Urochloa decumbens TaxID=240449 RepID=A0ABC9FMY3_9POAL